MTLRPTTRRFTAVLLLTAVVVLGTVHTAMAERTIALSTGTVDLALAPGGIATETIAVANNGDEPLAALVYTNDVVYDDEGLPEYVKPTGAAGEFNRSPASWLSLRMPAETQVIANTPYIELAPGEEMLIDFEMRVPDGATPGDYNAIIFFEMFNPEPQSGTSSQISGRIGARIVLRVAGDVIDRLDVAPYAVRGFVIGDVVPYSFTLANDGNIDKRYVPSLVVLDGTEAERMRSQIETMPIVYAGNTRGYDGGLKLTNANFGRYTMRVEIAYDKETGSAPGATIPETIVKDRSFIVIPLWFAIVVVLVVALPILWLVWRTSVRGAAKKAAAVSAE
ncbi:MAG: hypothetical protein Q7W44_05680 [Coriobacteriia bacterium]|nr:hypothetical protein [Coriobacteriia bacterium]